MENTYEYDMYDIYETVMIINTNTKVPTSVVDTMIKKYTELIQSFSTTKKIKINEVGEKKLAYEVKGNKTGYYVVFYYSAKVEDVRTLELELSTDEYILKSMTVKDIGSRISLEDFKESEQPDAIDVLLGLAEYKK